METRVSPALPPGHAGAGEPGRGEEGLEGLERRRQGLLGDSARQRMEMPRNSPSIWG